jgi:signal transduction histidine kinase
MKQDNYSLFKRVVVLVAVYLMIIFTLYGYESYKLSYKIFLHNTYEQLRTVSCQFEKEFSRIEEELIKIETDSALTKAERIDTANKLVQPIVSALTKDLGDIGAGYYSHNLEAILAITPWDDLNYLFGYTVEPDHPTQRLYQRGVGENTEITQIKRGKVVKHNKLFYDNGKVVGQILVNYPMKPFYLSFLKSMPPVFKIFFLSVLISALIVIYIYYEIKRATTSFNYQIEQFALNPIAYHLDQEWNKKLPVEFKGVTEKYLSMQKQVQQLINELTISARVSALGGMVATIAHDIRNPLSVIRSSAELGAMADKEENKNLFFQKIVYSSDKMEEMLKHFLLLVHSPSGNWERIEVCKHLKELISLISVPAARKGIEFIYDIDAVKNLYIEGVSIALTQALMNMLNNAIESTPSGGKVTISASQKEDKVEISITDTGQGIPEELQDKIFERFFTTKGEGTGIGLALAYSVISQHSGKIWFDSVEGQGSTFYVQFPVA